MHPTQFISVGNLSGETRGRRKKSALEDECNMERLVLNPERHCSMKKISTEFLNGVSWRRITPV